ncbi:hypothetical protein KKF34_12600 [Myxococcota bacterium]|nr:hypothetical protein [Myxococcota bacterium]MBU1497705.1 hypothetical protein [Myxococcota bacterium]
MNLRLLAMWTVIIAAPMACTGGKSSSRVANNKFEHSGKYSYQKITQSGKEKIIDREYWNLDTSSGKLAISLELIRMGYSQGVFPCNGSPSYTLKIGYRIKDYEIKGNVLTVKGFVKENTPSPCDGELPDLKNIQLEFLQGKRIFIKGNEKYTSHVLHKHGIEGTWIYNRSSRVENSSDNKYENEEWYLTQLKDGTIKGYQNRRETRISGDSEAFSCNGEKKITLFARYEITGKIQDNGQVFLKETAYKVAGNDPCEPSGRRYLDTYQGILVGDKLIIKSTESSAEQELQRSYSASILTENGDE